VKPNLRYLGLAAALGLALPSSQAELVTISGKAPSVVEAMQAVARELEPVDDPKQPLPIRLERIAAFKYTPATADKLRALFGTDNPLTIERVPAKADGRAWRARLQPLHYLSAPGSGLDWDEAILDLTLDKAGITQETAGRWNSISAGDGSTRLSASGITSSTREKRGFAGLWFGDSHVRVASVRVDGKSGPAFAMENLSFDWHTLERPKAVEVAYQSRIGAVAVAGERVEDIRFKLRVTQLDKQALADMQAESERQRKQAPAAAPAVPATQEQQLELLKPYLRSFGRSAIVRGTAIEIDEISARYHGNKASIRGHVGLAGAVESDLDDFKALAKKIVAKFEIRVPLAIVRDIAGAIATKQAQQQTQQRGNGANTQNPAGMGQIMTDVIVGKLVGGGFARIENEVLVSNLEYRNGELSANGKKVELPKPAVTNQSTGAVQRSRLAPNALQARRIEDSCRLPDFPEDVLERDLPLQAGFAYRIDAEGKVEDVRVTASSGHPAWDQAVVDAFGQCRYIPALQDGKPTGVQIDWNVARKAGGPRSPNPTP
jgi:TonB family protein